MQIWPAIDLRGGKCVRLRQGDYGQETVYGDQPAAMAARWVAEGAECLHLVDLDGAREGRPCNRPAVAAIVQAVEVPCELGGGIRDEETVADLLGLGLERLVIGTQAVKRPDWFRRLSIQFPGRLVAGIDARDGRVATDGWLETSSMSATALAVQLAELPIAAIVYTDIERDGMSVGPNLKATEAFAREVQMPVIASGGISGIEDVKKICLLAEAGVIGMITGRALYEGKLSLREAVGVAGG